MPRTMVALGGAALALLMVSTFSAPADARRGGVHGWSGARAHIGARPHYQHRPHVQHFAHRPFVHHHHHHRRRAHRHVFIGVPLAYGAYYYANGCEGLRQRALYTGSPYWWDRYYACLDGSYD